MYSHGFLTARFCGARRARCKDALWKGKSVIPARGPLIPMQQVVALVAVLSSGYGPWQIRNFEIVIGRFNLLEHALLYFTCWLQFIRVPLSLCLI